MTLQPATAVSAAVSATASAMVSASVTMSTDGTAGMTSVVDLPLRVVKAKKERQRVGQHHLQFVLKS